MRINNYARIAVIVTALSLGSTNSYAVMAYPGPITHTNPDGTTLTVRGHGDEWFNYMTTDDGHLIAIGDDGYYHYATVVNGQLTATDCRAIDQQMRSAEENAMLQQMSSTPEMVKELRAVKVSLNGPQLSYSDGTLENQSAVPTIGSPRFPVILVQFSDKEMGYDKQQFEDWLMKEGYNYNNGFGPADGSVYDYFNATSNGQFKPQFDVYGPVTASQKHDYYGYASDTSMKRVAALVREVCTTLSTSNDIDFSKYDNDGDGSVDVVYVVYAGGGAADDGKSYSSTNIWPHKWVVSADGKGTLKLNGKTVSSYGCSAALSYNKYFTVIGTFCHEFGHAIGLGDHYDTAYGDDTRDPGDWDIMASGSYNNNGQTPPMFSAYERSVMGWVKPTVLSDRGNFTLKGNATSEGYNDAYVIPTAKDNEYYVLENRQQTGWDAYLPHHGMLVWHIDYNKSKWTSNIINNTADHQYIDIVEAGGEGNTDETATPFPGKTNNRSFTDDTTPSMITWTGDKLSAPVTNITEATDGTISFNFKGGVPVESRLKLNDPVVSYDQATISWEPLDGVSEYYVTITNAATGATLVSDLELTANSYTISSLLPKTTYNYTVANYENYQWAEASSTFTTTVTPLSMRRPENVRTTEVGDTYFIAEWDETELAESYSVNVYTGVTGGEITETESFDDNKLSDGWTSSPVTPTFISTTGYYGTAAPSVSLSADNYLMSTTYDANITKVSLKSRRMGSTSATIVVYGRTDSGSDWETLLEKTVGSSKTTLSATVDASKAIHQIKIVETAESSKAIVDDIAITLDSSLALQPVEGKTGLNAEAETTYRVPGLEYATKYYYTVRAHNSTDDSIESSPVEVTTDEFTAIDNIEADNNSTVSVNGRVATIAPATDSVVGIYTPGGVSVISPVKVEAGAVAAFQLPTTGIYIVKVGSKAYKVVAK